MRASRDTDRGWAWVVLAATMGSNFIVGVLVHSVGIIHVNLLKEFQESNTLTSWACSFHGSLVSLASPIPAYVIGRYGCRACSVLGGVFCLIGCSTSAFVTSISQIFITYGLIAGVGMALICSPSIITVGYYFDKLLGFASGISIAAISVGSLSGSLIMQAMVDQYGLRGAFLLLGAITFHASLFGMFYRPTVFEVKDKTGVVKSPENVTRAIFLDDDDDDIDLPDTDASGKQPSQYFAVKNVCDGSEQLGQQGSEVTVSLLEKSFADRNNISCQEISMTSILAHDSNSKPGVVEEKLEPVNEVANFYGTKHDIHIVCPDVSQCHVSSSPPDKTHVEKDRFSAENNTSETREHIASPLINHGIHDEKYTSVAFTPRTDANLVDLGKPTGTSDSSDSTVQEKDCSSGVKIRRSPQPNRTWRKGVQPVCEVLTTWRYLCYSISMVAAHFSLYGLLVHLPGYVVQKGTSPTAAATLLVAFGVPSLLARLCMAVMTTDENIDPYVLNTGMVGLCAAVTVLFPHYSDTYTGQLIYSGLLGLYSGGQQALYAVLIVKIVGVDLLNTGFAIVSVFVGIGMISGAPAAAAIVDMGWAYEVIFPFLGSVMGLSFCLHLLGGLFKPRPTAQHAI